MLTSLLEFSLRQRILVLIFSAGLAAGGLYAFKTIPIDAFPDVTTILVQVVTKAEGLSPAEIERFITFPVETAMSGLPGIELIRSVSRFGLSAVTVYFAEGMDIYFARRLVMERLPAAREAIPAGLGTPEMGPISTGLGEIYYSVLDYKPGQAPPGLSRREQLMELKLLHDFVVKPQLRSVPGVAEVNASGGYEKQIVVLANPQQLLAAGLTFAELAAVVGENVENAGGGAVQIGGEQISIRADGRVRTAEEIAKIKAKDVRSLPGQFETASAVLGAIEGMQLYGRPDDYVSTLKSRIEAQDDEAERAAAREVIKPNAFTWVIVGDRSKIEQPIRELMGESVQVIDTDGKIVQ